MWPAPPPLSSLLMARDGLRPADRRERGSDGRTDGRGGGGVPLPWPGLGPTWGAAHWTFGTRSHRLYLSAQGQQACVLRPALGASGSARTGGGPGSAPSTSRGRLLPAPIRPGSTRPEKTPPPPGPHTHDRRGGGGWGRRGWGRRGVGQASGSAHSCFAPPPPQLWRGLVECPSGPSPAPPAGAAVMRGLSNRADLGPPGFASRSLRDLG